MPVSIPINTLTTLTPNRVTGSERIPTVQYEGSNAYTYQVAVSSLFYPDCIDTLQLKNGSVTGDKLGEGAPRWSNSGVLSLSGNLEVGNGTSSPLFLSLGYDRAAAGDTSIIMYSDIGTLPDATITRKTTANGSFDFTNYGTGFINIVQKSGAPILFKTNDTERMRIQSDGDVDIANDLIVDGTISTTDFTSQSITCTNNTATSLTNGALRLTGASGAIVIDDSGQKRISWNDGSGNFTIRGGNYYNSSQSRYVQAGSGASTITLNSDGLDGAVVFQAAPIGAAADDVISYTNTVTVGHDKFTVVGGTVNVGIGTSSPSEKLDVNGTVKSTSLNTGNSDLGQYVRTGSGVSTGEVNIAIGNNRTGSGTSKLLIYGTAGTGASGYGTVQKEGGNDGNFTISDTGSGVFYLKKDNAGGTMQFQTGGSFTRMTILADGKVGIKTTSPTTDLEVNGSVKASSFNTSSSIRYKKDITPLQDSLDIVSKLNAVRFTWKDTNKTEIGLIAEEVNKILPEFVLKNDKDEPEAIDYSKLTSILIGAINELQAIIKG